MLTGPSTKKATNAAVPGTAADVAFGTLALLLGLGAKAFYSGAGASAYAVFLAPSCWLAAHLGGIELVAEEGAGFISRAHRLVVGPACAGVNFFVVAFLAVYLTLLRCRPMTGFAARARGLMIAVAVAYGATILVNGLRIILAAHLFQLGGVGWLTPERLHRIAGVVIYGAAVVTLCRAVAPERRSPSIPIACYLGVAIGVPLLNGAGRTRLFVEHALVVTAVSLLVLAAARMLAVSTDSRGWSAGRSAARRRRSSWASAVDR